MFEKFTEPARQVVVCAQDEAQLLGHNYIGTEHLLLGLLREEDGLGARVLDSLGITLEEVRPQVERIIGRGEGTSAGQIPFTPRAKKALQLSASEAKAMGHRFLGTEHLLLGVARVEDGVAARILADFGAPRERVHAAVVDALSGPDRPVGPGPRHPRPRPPRTWEYRVEPIDGEVDVERLNALGGEGWELVTILPGEAGATAIFKRVV